MFEKYKHRINERIVCADGFSFSVQASEFHYCTPRVTKYEPYKEYEVGFPSVEEESLMPYKEKANSALNAVYGYVPRKVVEEIIAKHGGIVSGTFPENVEAEYLL